MGYTCGLDKITSITHYCRGFWRPFLRLSTPLDATNNIINRFETLGQMCHELDSAILYFFTRIAFQMEVTISLFENKRRFGFTDNNNEATQ